MAICEAFLPELDQEVESTRKLLACVPDDKLGWKPHEKSMSLGRLAGHVVEMVGWGADTINHDKLEFSGSDYKPFDPSSNAELLAQLDKNAQASRTAIAGASDQALMQPWSLIFDGHTVLTMPRAVVLRSVVFNHVIHHRGQLSVYLRLLDVPIPGMYGPSADMQ
jgi:uncharacterized damage-inducible protein DinB